MFHLLRHDPVDSRFDEVRKAFKTLGVEIFGLYFCVDFPSSSELIGYVDLTDSANSVNFAFEGLHALTILSNPKKN